MPSHKKGLKVWPTFIKILVNILKDPQSNEGIQWSSDGDHLIIRNTSFLVNQTLPKYFKHNNLSSFIRQLNMYSFKKLFTEETTFLVYSHPFFKREKEKEYRKIQRKSRKFDEDPEDIKLGQKKSVNQIKHKMLKLSEREEKLREQNQILLRERDELLKIKEIQEKEYENILRDFNNHQEFRLKLTEFTIKKGEEKKKEDLGESGEQINSSLKQGSRGSYDNDGKS